VIFASLVLSAGLAGLASAGGQLLAWDKTFSPNPIFTGDTTTLTFTIDNSALVLPASNLDFTDVLPAGLLVASPANASTTCTGGTITAVSGSGVISYTGGELAGMFTCMVDVDTTAATSGFFVNTSGDLTSALGNSGGATDTLQVIQPSSTPTPSPSPTPAPTPTPTAIPTPSPTPTATATPGMETAIPVALPPTGGTDGSTGFSLSLIAAMGAALILTAGGSLAVARSARKNRRSLYVIQRHV
jgi:uncharacterized repeat protein (TIGR01451 family)